MAEITSFKSRRKVEFVEVYERYTKISEITIHWYKAKAEVLQLPESNLVSRPFPTQPVGRVFEISTIDLLIYFESRCFPRTRKNAKEILNELGLKNYSPTEIVRKTKGVMFEDFIWMRFDGEDVSFDDVKIR